MSQKIMFIKFKTFAIYQIMFLSTDFADFGVLKLLCYKFEQTYYIKLLMLYKDQLLEIIESK